MPKPDKTASPLSPKLIQIVVPINLYEKLDDLAAHAGTTIGTVASFLSWEAFKRFTDSERTSQEQLIALLRGANADLGNENPQAN